MMSVVKMVLSSVVDSKLGKSMAQSKHTSGAAIFGFLIAASGVIWPDFKPKADELFKLAMLYGLTRAGDAPMPPRNPDDKRQRKLPLGPMLILGAMFVWLLAGCGGPGSSNRAAVTYKVAAATVVTAEQASDAWLDYYVTARKLPGADLNKLDSQDRSAANAWAVYQNAMETVYQTRKAVAAGTETPEQLERVLAASRDAAQAVVRIVLVFLPPERANKLKGSP